MGRTLWKDVGGVALGFRCARARRGEERGEEKGAARPLRSGSCAVLAAAVCARNAAPALPPFYACGQTTKRRSKHKSKFKNNNPKTTIQKQQSKKTPTLRLLEKLVDLNALFTLVAPWMHLSGDFKQALAAERAARGSGSGGAAAAR